MANDDRDFLRYWNLLFDNLILRETGSLENKDEIIRLCALCEQVLMRYKAGASAIRKCTHALMELCHHVHLHAIQPNFTFILGRIGDAYSFTVQHLMEAEVADELLQLVKKLHNGSREVVKQAFREGFNGNKSHLYYATLFHSRRYPYIGVHAEKVNEQEVKFSLLLLSH